MGVLLYHRYRPTTANSTSSTILCIVSEFTVQYCSRRTALQIGAIYYTPVYTYILFARLHPHIKGTVVEGRQVDDVVNKQQTHGASSAIVRTVPHLSHRERRQLYFAFTATNGVQPLRRPHTFRLNEPKGGRSSPFRITDT